MDGGIGGDMVVGMGGRKGVGMGLGIRVFMGRGMVGVSVGGGMVG